MSTNPANHQVRYLSISHNDAGQRIDNCLLRHLKGVPRSLIYRLLRRGEVRVNKKRTKPQYRLNEADIIRIPPIRTAKPPIAITVPLKLIAQLQNAILYEDDYLLVINKPAGLAVHGGSGITIGFIEALRTIRSDQPFLELAHRIDKQTSGCIMIAKQRSALNHLHQQLQQGTIDKRYLMLAMGQWGNNHTTVTAPLRKNTLSSGERIVRVTPIGKPSRTVFTVIKRYSQATLLEAHPMTGRMHQIRVHAQHLKHPLLGDNKYGNTNSQQYTKKIKLQRLFLHASRLCLLHPHNKKPLTIEAPLEVTLQQLVNQLT